MADAPPFAAVPTLVVTGAWSPLDDEVADTLTRRGATRVVLPGRGHRPQDHDDAWDALRAHVAAATA